MSSRMGRRGPGWTSLGWLRHMATILAVLAVVGATMACIRALRARWQAARTVERGVAIGVAGLLPGTRVDPWGVNVALEQHADEQALGQSLDLLAAGGFRWVRQRFPWSEIEPAPGVYRWERWDAIVRACRARGLQVVAVLDGSPAWARAPEDASHPSAPPRNVDDWAAFVRMLAQRYAEQIDHYQVWDQPNIYPHWGERDPDPAGYLALLRAARRQIHEADPRAMVVMAGLAPNTETGGRNLSDLLYLRGLYEAGGLGAFDAVAVKAYGFWSGPEDLAVGPETLNFSRLVAVREEMVRHGDSARPIWAVAWGWNSLPADWSGQPSPWGSDAAIHQHQRSLRAIERAREEWPWLALMFYAAWQPAVPADHPLWGMSLLDRRGAPGPLYQKLKELARQPEVHYLGYHTVPRPAGNLPVQVRFWGSRVDLVGPGSWELVELNGRRLVSRVTAGEGELAVVVQGQKTGLHHLSLQAIGPSPSLQIAVSRERLPWLPSWLAALLLAAAVLALSVLWYLLRPYPWQRWANALLGAYRGLSPWAALGVGVAALALMVLLPGLAPSLLGLALVAVVVSARRDVGLMLAVALVPLAPLHKAFGPLRFSYLETVTLLVVAAQVWREWRLIAASLPGRPWGGVLRQRLRAAIGEMDALDAGVLMLVAAALLSLAASDWLRVSVRELRVVVLQAAFLYWLVRQARLDREGTLRLVDVLVASATLVSLHGLHQYGWTEGVIQAEGVRRVRSIYGSPNNVALVLGRVLPLMLAVALRDSWGRRRWVYGLAAVPATACFFLTFSRGGWFVGLPAALVVLGLIGGRWARLLTVGLACAGIIGLVPVLGTARLQSLIAFEGTGRLRVGLWEAAWEMAGDHPLLGVGLDNFLYHYPRYIRPEAMDEPFLSHPHNLVLDIWLRLGLPGLAAFGWLLWSFFRRVFNLWRQPLDPGLSALTAGLIAGMVYTLAHGLVDAAFFFVELAGLFAIMLALLRAVVTLAEARASDA